MRQASNRLALTLAATIIIVAAVTRPAAAERDGCLADETRERGVAHVSGDVLNVTGDEANAPIDIAFGAVRLRETGGLLRAGASGCGMDVDLRLAGDRVNVGMASVFTGDGVKDGNLERATHWQYGRTEVNVVRRNGIKWRIGGSLLQVSAPDAARPDRGANGESELSLLDGRLRATSSLAWAEHGDAAGTWAGAQQHRIRLRLYEEGSFVLTGFAGYERAESGFAGRAVNMTADRERETFGLGLRWRRIALTLERSDERDNVDDDGSSGNRWDGWRSEARFDVDGHGRMPRQATLTFDRKDRHDGLTTMLEERRDRVRLQFGWRDGLALRLSGRTTTEFGTGGREEATHALGIAAERAFPLGDWHMSGRAGASQAWADVEMPDEGVGLNLSLQARHNDLNALNLRFKARLKREVDDGGDSMDTDYRVGIQAELTF